MTNLEVDQPLTPDQQLLMAYLDDELTGEERVAFEQRLATEPQLAAEAAGFQCLTDLTQSMSLAEPTDHEIQRFWSSFYNRSEWQLGWVLLLAGLTILTGYGIYELLVTDLVPWLVKIAAVIAIAGGAILFWNTLRLKMRTTRFDRYRGVLR